MGRLSQIQKKLKSWKDKLHRGSQKDIVHTLTPQAVFTTTGVEGTSTRKVIVGPAYQQAPPSRDAVPIPPLLSSAEPSVSETQADTSSDLRTSKGRQVLAEFEKEFDNLKEYILNHYHSSLVGQPCSCGGPLPRSITCRDCLQYETCCTTCFITNHRQNPLHWAQVWNPAGFFEKRDISTLSDEFAIQLGHSGSPCPTPAQYKVLPFRIIHSNGIHSTRVKMCECGGAGDDRVRQLMDSRLFPATVTQPETALTFEVLTDFHLHSMQSKVSGWDYWRMLQRRTDNVFTTDINDFYEIFLRATRVWAYLKVHIRSGQSHGIDKFLPLRPAGNLVVFCPACPEPDVNMELGWQHDPDSMKHLHQCRRTNDGNFQANRFKGQGEGDNVSLWRGKGYFPPDDEYKTWLAGIEVTNEKSVCAHLKAVNGQSKTKFKNCDVTGVSNTQCDHCLVQATCDMYGGERYAYTDASLGRSLDQKPFGTPRCPHRPSEAHSYDCECQYCVNLYQRFSKHLPHLASRIPDMIKIIPSLHIVDHVEDCMYKFHSGYKRNLGHFHGESAETYWPELNQLSSRTRQMTNGHRQDTISDHNGDWNWKKVITMGETLERDLVSAAAMFGKKEDHFRALTISFADRVHEWNKMDRDAVREEGKRVWTVYRHKNENVPSLDRLLSYLTVNDGELSSSISISSIDSISCLFKEGFLLQDEQRRILQLQNLQSSHPLESREEEMTSALDGLQSRIAEWRLRQVALLPAVSSDIDVQNLAAIGPEKEVLFLPSDFSSSLRTKHGLVAAAVEEGKMREAEIFDTLRALQTTAKTLSAMQARKKKNNRGQRDGLRSNAMLDTVRHRRELEISRYNTARQALIKLDLVDPKSDIYPILTEKDTWRKSTERKYTVGDSKRTDGAVFRIGLLGRKEGETSLDMDICSEVEGQESDEVVTALAPVTQRTKRKPKSKITQTTGKSKSSQTDPDSEKTPLKHNERKDGWIWSLGKLKAKMTDSQMEEWSNEGDRVQWFRAESEMYTWLEQWELKHAEFARTIDYFGVFRDIWARLAEESSNAGAVAYARRQSAMYEGLREVASRRYRSCGYAPFVNLVPGERLAETALKFRSARLRWFADFV